MNGSGGRKSDRVYGAFNELDNTGKNIHTGRPEGRLSFAEWKRRIVENSRAREKYRTYGKKEPSVRSIIFREIIVTVYWVMLLALFLLAFVLASVSFIVSAGYFLGTIVVAALIVIIAFLLTRAPRKRAAFMRRLRRHCKKSGHKLYKQSGVFSSLRRPSGKTDFVIEAHNTIWEVMFFPAPRRLCAIHFTQPEHALVVTGILKNRLKMIFFMRERVREVRYAFERTSRVRDKKVTRILLLNPTPYSLRYYDEKEKKPVDGGSGCNFFGFTAYTGSAFINMLNRG